MKRYLLPLLTISFFLPAASFAQPGCTDPQANNFSATATSNDGSCQYPPTNYIPVFKSTLPSDLKEVSGHVKVAGQWYAHNDGGDDPRFYRFDPETGNISQEVKLKDASNKDWEDMAASSTDIYLGDFGNNNNNRENLGIYKVPISAIGNSGSESINNNEWAFLPFHYADQTDFSTLPEDSTVFDCEAMIFFNGKLHLFTKNRRDNITSHYVVNQAAGTAEKIETFDVNGQISGADVSPDGKVIALLGYNLEGLPTVFTWLLWDWQTGSDLFFSGNKRRIELGSALLTGQAEGIGFSGNRNGYLTNERTIANNITFVNESVRYFDISQWVPESVGTDEPFAAENFRVFPNPFSQEIHFEVFENKKPEGLRIVNVVGQVMLESDEVPDVLDVKHFPSGIYTVSVITGDRIQSVKMLKQ